MSNIDTRWEQALSNKVTNNGKEINVIEKELKNIKSELIALNSKLSNLHNKTFNSDSKTLDIEKQSNDLEKLLLMIAVGTVMIATLLIANFIYTVFI